MHLTIQQIEDYIHCPLKYKFRWVDEIDMKLTKRKIPNKWHMTEEFDKALHHVTYGIFHQLADESYPNAHYVKKRWGIVWSKDRSREDIVFDTGSWRNEHRKMERKGLAALLALHEDFSKRPGTPILIGKAYVITVAGHDVTGVIDMVRETHDAEDNPLIEIMELKTDERPTNLHIKGDISVTAASLAFRNLFGHKEQRITYYGMLNQSQIETKRTVEDYRLLEHTVDNVARGIKAEIYFPVLNHKCNECPFQKHCEKKEWF